MYVADNAGKLDNIYIFFLNEETKTHKQNCGDKYHK